MKKQLLFLFSLAPILSFTAFEQLVAFSLETEIVSSTDVSCHGGADGAATATATGGEPPYSFLWSNGSEDSSSTNLEAGLYELTVTDSAGTTATASVTIGQPEALEINILNVSFPHCPGGENGSINTSGQGGSPLYDYLWSTGDTGPNLTGLTAGEYSVTITDANGCEAEENITLFDPDSITISVLLVENESCDPGGDGAIFLIPSGGQAPVEILWSNDSTGNFITQLEAGIYAATITDNLGCVVVFEVEVGSLEAVDYELETGAISCYGGSDGSISISPLGDDPPYFVFWEDGNQGFTRTGLQSGTYQFIIQDGKGCTSLDSIYLQDPDSITIELSLTQPHCPTCSNGMISAEVSGGTGSYNYMWNVDPYYNENYISHLVPGFYSLTVTDNNGCEAFISVELTHDGDCLGIAPYFYNHTSPFCNLQELEGFCLFMGPPFPPAFTTWPGCEHCCAFHNPQWFTFVASDSGEISLDIEIIECIGQGVQIALYELGFQTLFDPTEHSPGIQPTADMLISNCNLVSAPQTGIVNFTVPDVQRGQLFGIVVDGWSNAVCKVKVLEVISGGDTTSVTVDSIPSAPEFDNSGYGFSPGDTLCQGAEGVVFSIDTVTTGPWFYIWTVDGTALRFPGSHLPSVSIDFPNAGTFEVCVRATNYCDTSPQKCTEVVVASLPSFHHTDTSCLREIYLYDGPFGTGAFGPFSSAGDIEIEGNVADANGCQSDIFLNLHLIGDNYDEPTELFALICGGDSYVFPEPGHHDPQVFNSTGLYGLDGELSIPQAGIPGSAFACDSFFTLELVVLEATTDSLDFTCTEISATIFPSTSLILPGLEAYAEDISVDYEWRRGSDGLVLESGNWSDSSDLDLTVNFSDFEENTEVFHLHLFTRYSNDPDDTVCEDVYAIELNLDELTSLELNILGPDTLVTDQDFIFQVEELQGAASLFSWSFDPEPEDVVIDFSTRAVNLVYSEAGIVEICVSAENFCGVEHQICIEVVVDTEVDVPYYPREEANLKVYPNPFDDILYVHSDNEIGSASWEIYNVAGTMVLTGDGDYEKNIAISMKSLPSGVYVLQLKLDEGPFVFKVVKQK